VEQKRQVRISKVELAVVAVVEILIIFLRHFFQSILFIYLDGVQLFDSFKLGLPYPACDSHFCIAVTDNR